MSYLYVSQPGTYKKLLTSRNFWGPSGWTREALDTKTLKCLWGGGSMWGAIAKRRKMIQVFCFFTLLVLQLWCFSWQVQQVWASSNAENQGWWQSLTFTESINTSYSHLPKLHQGGSLILIFHSRKLVFKLRNFSKIIRLLSRRPWGQA